MDRRKNWRRFRPRATAAALARLGQMARRFEALIDRGTLLELYDANLAFHAAFLALAGNVELVELVDTLRRRTSSAPASQWRTRARIAQSAREHHAMLAALRAGDVAALRRIVALHIRQPSDAASKKGVAKMAAPARPERNTAGDAT